MGIPADVIDTGALFDFLPPDIRVNLFKIVFFQDKRNDLREFEGFFAVIFLPLEKKLLVVHCVGMLVPDGIENKGGSRFVPDGFGVALDIFPVARAEPVFID